MSGPVVAATTSSRDGSAKARWAAVEALFHEAVGRPATERRQFLDETCTDPTLRSEVEALISAHERRGSVDELMDRVMAPLLAQTKRPATDVPGAPVIHARYRILERLGGGGMGVVYRARDERLERDVALKFLSPQLSADPAAKKRFLVEARAAAAIEHPNICTVHEIGDAEDGQLCIVMACYDGETLERRIARGPIAVRDALHIAGEIARGLGKAHERGIIHRDIKPANIAITADELVKILDFGIAKLTDSTINHTIGAIGTLAYMSPEQAFGDAIDHRTDIWSLGVVLYEMLTGARPFRGPGEQAILFGALAVEPEPVSSTRSDVPAAVDSVIRRALAKRVEDRFANANELASALAACESSIEIGNEPATHATAEPKQTPEASESPLTRGGERRQVATVSCLIVGNEMLVERLSPEQAESILNQIRDAAVEICTHHGGIVNHFFGDGLVMLFGVPSAHEDDAVRAVRAALELHARIANLPTTLDQRLSTELRLRSGVHIGQAIVQRLRSGDRRFRVTGAPRDVAVRLVSVADSDEILVSPEVRRLVAPFIHTVESRSVTLNGDGAVVTPHRVVGPSGIRSRLEGRTREQLTPFVGRDRERALLNAQLETARGGAGRFVVLIGEAGVGKSRLLHELRVTASIAGIRMLAGRCDAYGTTTPFRPFIEAVHDALGLSRGGSVSERVDAAIASIRAIDASLEEYIPLYLAMLSIPSDAHPVPERLRGELFQAAMFEAVGALFTLTSRETPTLLLLEDWHWADAASRAALRQLVEIVPEFPLFVVVTSRPDGSDWGTAAHQLLVPLAPLDGTASAAIACAVFGAERIAPGFMARLHEQTGGNPFFLEELCEALREAGAVTLRDGEAAANAISIHVPETVQGVLRTRMDRLDDRSRDVLRLASVIGRDFTHGVLADVAELDDLGSAIERLIASGVVQQVATAPEITYRFKHTLAEEVAYDSLLAHQRVVLHAAVGRAIERRYAGQLDEHVARLADHFSRAEEWPEAVRYGLREADRATAITQNADALATLERVEQWVFRLPDGAGRRDLEADVLLRQERLCETLGLRSRQLALVDRLISLLAPFGPSERLAQAYLRQGDAFTLLRRYEAAERALGTALRIAGELDDAVGERHSLRSLALLRSYEGRNDEALSTIQRVLALGRATGDTRAEAGDLATMANILRAMGQPERALPVLQTALARTQAADNPIRYGALLNVIGTVYRDMGDYETALEYFRRVPAQGVERRHPVNASFTLPAIAQIQLQQGLIDEALDTYRQAVEINRRARYADGSAHACRSLGEVLMGLGRDDEAVAYLRDAAALFAQLEDRANESLMWQRLAAGYERLRKLTDAQRSWERVRELHHVSGNLPAEAEAAEGVARVAKLMGAAPERLVEHYHDALELAIASGDRQRELAVRNGLGIVHWQRGAYVDALREYESALRLCHERGDHVHAGLILNSLGATLHRLRRWDEARTILAEAVRVADDTGERQLRAYALATLADVCLASGRLDEARASAEASLRLRRELDDRRGEAWMLEHLARIHSARRDITAARAAAEAAAPIAETVGDRALEAAVARLRTSTDFTDFTYFTDFSQS